MRLFEIIEAQNPQLRNIKNAPVTFAVTKRFVKEFKDFAKKYPKIKEDFIKFIDVKSKDINNPFSAKDSVWGSGVVRGISGWFHPHLFFGKAILIYRPVGQTIIFAGVKDHSAVEGVSNKIQSLGEYLASINLNNIENISADTLFKDLDIDQTDIEASENDETHALNLFYLMAANREDRKLMVDFYHDMNEDLFEFFKYNDPPIDENKISKETIKQLIQRVLQEIPQP